MTEFNVAGEKLYLSPVIDLYKGEITTHEMSTRPVVNFVIQVVEKAKNRLKEKGKPLVYSDQS